MLATLGRARSAGLLPVLMLAASASIAQAAAVTSIPGDLGAAAVAVGRCTSAGLGVVSNLAGAAIASVTVSSLPVACGGASLQVTVNNGLTNSSGSATVPGGGGAVSVPLAVAVAVTTQVQTDLVLTGP